MLRSQLDVQGQATGVRSGWVALEGDKYVRQTGD